MDDFTQKMMERAQARRQKLQHHLSQASRLVTPLNADPSLTYEDSQQPKKKSFLSDPQALKRIAEKYSADSLEYDPLSFKRSVETSTLNSLTSAPTTSAEILFNNVQTNLKTPSKSDHLKINISLHSGPQKIKSASPHKRPASPEGSDAFNKKQSSPIESPIKTQLKSASPCNQPASPKNDKNPIKSTNTFKKAASPKNETFNRNPIKSTDTFKKSASPKAEASKNIIKSTNTFKKTGSPKNETNTKYPLKSVNTYKKAASPKMGVSSLDQKESSVLKRAAMFENKQGSPLKAKCKDPAELTLAERKALFEKNKGEVLLPKVAFATPLPAKLRTSPAKTTKGLRKNIENAPPKELVCPKVLKDQAVNSLKEKFESNLVEMTNSNMSQLERQKELEFLSNRWNRNKDSIDKQQTKTNPVAVQASPATPTPPPMPQAVLSPPVMTSSPGPQSVLSPVSQRTPEPYKDSPEALKALQGVKRIVVSPPTKGSLYPSLSDIEAASDEGTPTSSPENSKNSNIYLNMSFGDILEASKNNPLSPAQGTREKEVLTELDAALDEALDDVTSSEDEEEEEESPRPPKMSRSGADGTTASSSFEYGNGGGAGDVATPLLHTVSFYRKQQNNLSTPGHTPMKVIKRNEEFEPETADYEDESAAVQKRITELTMEVTKEQSLIAQASNALTHCMTRVEFLGSTEQVESERVLLLSGHKRRACLNEIDRLKVEGSLRPRGSNSRQLREQGDLIISNITIPLKREALHAMAAEESMLYFVCLIKCEERVIATPVVSASSQNLQGGTTLTVAGEFRLEKLYCDFKASIEVYYMVLSRELLPHHIKYHLNGKKEKRLLTPIKSKKSQSRLVVQSPAGPNAVHSTNFQLGGYVVFSLKELKRTQWTLNKVPYTSPLEGSLSMRIASSLKLDNGLRGFLSMFDDVSGYGAWHRRWCVLSDHTLAYWKYPDDENKKVPLGSVDLRTVVTETVGLVSRDICARLHSFLMETTRPREPQDTESLILILDGEIARIRHILSADTKEERIEWCSRLNKTLALIRAWNCQM